jgi:murein L,D-transpeptidase YafK
MERANVSFAMAEKLAMAGHYQRASDKLRQTSADIAIVHGAWLSLHARFSDRHLRAEWNELARAVIQESRDRATFAIVVDKLRRQLILYYRGLRMVAFEAELGANGLRQKEHAGDRATPEGLYRVVRMKEGKATKYYKALLVDYPNERDRARFAVMKRQGRIPSRAGIGGMIEIHGEGGEGNDWTDGCVALTNKNMDMLFARVRVGTAVAIVGTFGG